MVINPIFKGQMINRILHEWSFHMKSMKFPEDLFHKYHMMQPPVSDTIFSVSSHFCDTDITCTLQQDCPFLQEQFLTKLVSLQAVRL